MRESLFHLPITGLYPEDHWFKGAVIASILLHAAVFIGTSQQTMDTVAQASHHSVTVSLNLLMQQQQHLLSPKTSVNVPAKKISIEKQPATNRSETTSGKPAHKNVQAKSLATKSFKATAPQLAEEMVRGSGQQHLEISEQYLAKLLTHIESYKYYPRVAQRRGIEGVVRVSFRLLPQGEIDQLSTSGAHMLLQKAAQAAVQQALPMLSAPAQITLPYNVSFVMQFELPAA